MSWKNVVRFVVYFFSLSQLFGSLFSPWRADRFDSVSSSAVERFFQNLIFQLLTRFVGFIIRLTVIIIGIVALGISILLFPVFLILPITLRYEKMVRAGSWGKSWSYPLTSFLDKHAQQLWNTQPAYVPPSREIVIEQIDRILARENQSHVIFIGAQGVGKTSVLKEFARRVYWGLVSPSSLYKRVVQLIPDEMSGEDIEKALADAVSAKNIILVIENVQHNSHMLKTIIPYLDVKGFQMILSTDYDFYQTTLKYQDSILQVMTKVELMPPSTEETQEILAEYIHTFSRKVTYDEDVIPEIVHYTDMLMQHEPQPEKSIDIVEELIAQNKHLNKEMVQSVVSQKTNVPVGSMTRDEAQFLLGLEEQMKKKIIGQTEAITQVTQALKRSRAGIGSTQKPIGVFLFLGPTGVGKTYTAQVLAEMYFGGKDAMIRFDMSEFRDLSTLGSFIQRAADAIEAHPFSLFFVDEIEKAHPDILNIFLQIFDEGRLTMENGRTVSFNNAIIICTTNAGGIALQENLELSKNDLIDMIIESGVFRPEFLNRFDATVRFLPLDQEQVLRVTRLMLESVVKRVQEQHNITIMMSDALVTKVATAGFDPKFGARPIRRAAQELVENMIADKILKGEVVAGGVITLE